MFNILVVNIGSTSLKFNLFEMINEEMLVKGIIERIGNTDSPMRYQVVGSDPVNTAIDTSRGYGEGIKAVLQLLRGKEIKAIGFKTVHAGEFRDSTVIDDSVINKMEEYAAVVPVHNPCYIKAINQCREMFPDIPLVAVFETKFHSEIPDYAYHYSIPYEWYQKYAIRKYGFHGASHRYVSQRAAELLQRPLHGLKMISCHLGGSSSVSAIKGGRSIDNSMGFSAQAGIPMSTRCGDIDLFIIPFIMKKEKMGFEEVMNVLAERSGLLGLSGKSGDMRELEENYAIHYRSRLAFDQYCYSVKKYIGSYFAVLEGTDALIFTGGIGENSYRARERICQGLQCIGLDLDKSKNMCRAGGERLISTDRSKVKIMIIPTNEALIVARETYRVINCNSGGRVKK
jgi:acetate kinase